MNNSITIVKGTVSDVFELQKKIPEFNSNHTKNDIEQRLSKNGLVLKALIKNKKIGGTESAD